MRKRGEKKKGLNKVNRYVFWIPRVFSLIFAGFLFLFSFDVFEDKYTFWQIAVAFLMHNIPVFIILIIIWISWKYEIVGGIFFILAGIFYIIMVALSQNNIFRVISWSLTIAGPAFAIGVLFLLNWFWKKRN